MHPRLAEIAASLEETRAAVVRAVERLASEDAGRRHLARIERTIVAVTTC